MCGIAGYAGEGSESVVRSMIESLSHRGPDYLGTWSEPGIGLGHARLSILDLREASNQPFIDHTGRYIIVFNGEIYNYRSLGQALERERGVNLRTTCDTEVVVELYSAYGPEMLNQLNGMFAMAIFDREERSLFLARDRMGQKPLFYAQKGECFAFGSELKALVRHPKIEKVVSLEALNAYATFEYVPTPLSIFEGVYKLEPGHYGVFADGTFRTQPFYQLDYSQQVIPYDQARQAFAARLEAAVSDRMISDVPLGVFLSGGLDSSSVAYYAKKNSSRRISTFSIGFEDPSYDESSEARLVADAIGSDHHSQVLTASHTKEIIPEVYAFLDEPFADASLIPTYLLSKFTRQQMTVALGGDGSDELLAGYPTFQALRTAKLLFNLPKGVIIALRKMAARLPRSDKNISFDFKVNQFLRGFELGYEQASTLWLGSFLPSEKQALFSPDVRTQITSSNGLEVLEERLAEVASEPVHHRILHGYFRTYLLDDILVKVDRASMYNSLEVRSPFLDYRLVDFCNSLPYHHKYHKGTGKRILKDVMRGKIPDRIIDRPKKGFGIPVSRWIREELRDECESLLSSASLAEHGFFDPKYVIRIKDEHMQGRANHRKLIWTLMVFQRWYRQMMK